MARRRSHGVDRRREQTQGWNEMRMLCAAAVLLMLAAGIVGWFAFTSVP